jgi:hypothetical protein
MLAATKKGVSMRILPPYLIVIMIGLSFALPKAQAADPYEKADDTWISLSGTAVSPKPDSFILDYGQGVIQVEVDDQDWFHEGNAMNEGNRVIVTGKIDDDLYDRTSIEAYSVYIQDQNRYIYASSKDEERWFEHSWTPVTIGETTIRGKVVTTNPEARQFTIDTGTKKLTVDTGNMSYNPLDDYGFQRIRPGDKVIASGVMTRNFLTTRNLQADMVTTLQDSALTSKSKNKKEKTGKSSKGETTTSNTNKP